jgi:hypothetical protein
MKHTLALIISLALLTGSAFAADKKTKDTAIAEPKTASPKGAKVYILFPKDGKSVKKKFTIRFGLKGMGIAPAGIKFPNTGHHHLIIDGAKFDINLPLQASDQIKHFGGGQTEATIELPLGKHTLQLVLGDHLHRPHDPPVLSKTITITVKE